MQKKCTKNSTKRRCTTYKTCQALHKLNIQHQETFCSSTIYQPWYHACSGLILCGVYLDGSFMSNSGHSFSSKQQFVLNYEPVEESVLTRNPDIKYCMPIIFWWSKLCRFILLCLQIYTAPPAYQNVAEDAKSPFFQPSPMLIFHLILSQY